MIDQLIPGLETSAQTHKISLSLHDFHVITPPGNNLYELFLENRLQESLYIEDLEFFTESDNFAAQQVTAREVDQDVTLSKTSPQISRWLRECVQHPCCPQQIDFPLPTRLIDVETEKICHTNGAFGKFVALSYCWGSGSQSQLRSDTIQTLMQYLDFNNLPQTIKDAVLVTRSLSIRYLWVDALCIIQDDPQDKAREIGSMAQIYSNAYITILASNARDAADGFLAHRYEIEGPNARIPFRIAPNRFGSVTARKHFSRSSSIKAYNPLSTRAWALQEQMMASRILAYTKHTLEWRCASGTMNLNNSLNADLDYDPVPKLISQLSTDPEEALSEWVRIVNDYSRRNMSLQSDKLPAIAALAERFAAVLGHYYAGLWRYDLIRQLCWWTASLQSEARGDLYRAPSWSWASANEISWPLTNRGYEDCCNVISVEVVRKNAQVPYGEVIHASIKIYGKIIIASMATTNGEGGGKCMLNHAKTGVMEPPLQRFYRTYFQQGTNDTAPSQTLVVEVIFFWDYDEEFRSDPLFVCKF
ncbi:heterokaryon incompatibility protein-domain-containing protein [Alternaria rosae]|uniref:heterokaryon incompatibility protein-domain-containing protein n=1 Tax=Alternaria rosae TaxID=1187941 RepID=UPI001E8DCF31|nr:heterokaryon incompatibility protein-domain-containing protein [Alternaria rosae]KAH6865544.1 heterokaryon incompatibility protein-domain-containing protein [Alternaria rosae]